MKTMTIHELLHWAYCQELGKVGGTMADTSGGYSAAWERTQEMAALGTLIDRSPNVFGIVPTSVYEGEPHVDALTVGQFVRKIETVADLAPPSGWQPFPEFDDPHGVIAEEIGTVVSQWWLKGERANSAALQALIVRSAVIGRGPDWSAEAPRVVPLMKWGNPMWFIEKKTKDALGRVYAYETDGFDKRKRRPRPGAYQKYRLVEPMRGAIMARLDWHLWQMALARLANGLANHLIDHRIAGFIPFRAPWEEAAELRASL